MDVKTSSLTLKDIIKDRIVDWIFTILLALVVIPLSDDKLFHGYERFYLKKDSHMEDPSLDYPYVTDQTFNVTALIFTTFLIPIFVVCVTQVVKLHFETNWNWVLDLHNFFLAMLQSAALSQTVTAFMKVYAGRLRPDFYARLETGDSSTINSGMRGYPSGHASFAFMGMTLLSMYLCGKLKLVGTKNAFTKFFFAGAAPIIVAIIVSVSRTRDYVHDFSDINAGAGIGFISSVCCYQLNFHPLADENSDLAYYSHDVDVNDQMALMTYRRPISDEAEDDYATALT